MWRLVLVIKTARGFDAYQFHVCLSVFKVREEEIINWKTGYFFENYNPSPNYRLRD